MNIRYPIYEGVYRILTHHRSLCSGYVCRSGNNAKSDKGCVGYVVGSYLPILLVSREIGLL